MSKETANSLAHAESLRIAALNPGRTDLPVENVGSAVLGFFSSDAMINRVKDRIAVLDQEEVMSLIDSEVGAVRADRP